MRRPHVPVLATAMLLLACSDQTVTELPFEPQAAMNGQAPVYLVTFRDGVDVASTTHELAGFHGLAVRHMREHAARGFSAVIPEARLRKLQNDPRVALVERDGPVTLVKPSAKGDVGTLAAQVTPWGIARVTGAGAVSGAGKTAWIIDTGIDLRHSDLNTSRSCHRNFVPWGKNSAADGNGHGTHVAGTIAAKNNSIDVVGVAPNAFVCAIRVLDNTGSGTWEAVINGVNWVAKYGQAGEVANLSLGGEGRHETLEKAITDAAAKGIKFVLAAGNNGGDAANFTPAAVTASNVYTISAIGSNGCLTAWSNWGSPVDFAAPGENIVSTRKGGGTTTMSGTSMAAPHVAGLLLLGNVTPVGTACGDPDGKADPIAHR
jgi:subtilisin family serine protease